MPTTATISCPSCSTQLAVPIEAAGKRGRCPFCHGRFVVPPKVAEPVDEDLITDWLSAGGDDEDDDDGDGDSGSYGGRLGQTLREKEGDEPPPGPADPPAFSMEGAHCPHPRPDAPEGAADAGVDRAPLASDRPAVPPQPAERPEGRDPAGVGSVPPEPTEPASPAGPDAGGGDSAPAAHSDGDGSHDAATAGGEKSVAEEQAPPRRERELAKEDASEREKRRRSERKRRYVVESAIRPQQKDEKEDAIEQQALFEQAMERRSRKGEGGEPTVPHDHPRLNLLMANTTSVLLGFEARLLLRPAFRASMPIRCAECGATERDGMVARPLAWHDRGHGGAVAAGELEASYETEVLDNHTPYDIVDHMLVMDELIAPFNRPMPYYLCHRCSISGGVTCEALDTSSSVLCEVTVPNPQVALEWLGRVNGICGDDYEQLRGKIARLATDAWQKLNDTVRRRLSVWFHLADDEQFVAYFNDGDFARKDAGLAGVVLTDKRMVFCKYHHHAKMKLRDTAANLKAVRSGSFYDLIATREDTVKKLIRLRPDDLDGLIESLEEIEAPLQIRRE